MPVRHLAIMAAVTAALSIASPALAAAPPPTANTIIIKNFDFMPMSLTIKAGTAVSWKNQDGEPHTVTSVDGLFRSGAIDQDESFTFTFTKPGTYKYLCSIHPRMTGSIVVQ